MRIEEFERRLTAILEALLAVGLFAMFVVVVALVTMRYLFETGLVGANESSTVVFIYLSAIGAAVAVGRQEHIQVDLFSRKLSWRWKRRLEFASLLAVASFNIVLVERGLVWISITGHTLMPATQLPRITAQISVPLGCGLAALYCCTRIVILLRERPQL